MTVASDKRVGVQETQRGRLLHRTAAEGKADNPLSNFDGSATTISPTLF